MQYSLNLGNYTRKIAYKCIANPFSLSSIHHQCAVLCGLRAEQEVGPGMRWKVTFHRSDVKVDRTILHGRFAISTSSFESERLDTNWVMVQSVLKDMMVDIRTTYADLSICVCPMFSPDINLTPYNVIHLLFRRPLWAIISQTSFV